MKKHTLVVAMIALLLVSLVAASVTFASPPETNVDQKPKPRGKIVVANRGSGTISVIDVASDQATTIPLPTGNNPPEPMYVVYSRTTGQVFVGDRANDRVVVFDADDWSVAAPVTTGAGVFHMWADPQDNQLWVNNDIDNTVTVINPRTLEVLTTLPLPADLVALGGKPHDVVLDNQHAYVTMVGLTTPTGSDWVIKFSKRTYQEVGRAVVPGDPHVSLTLTNPNLYVPAQAGNAVIVLDRRTLERVAEVAVPGAHGAGMAGTRKTFYTTNLPGGGAAGLWTIDIRTNTVVGSPVDTPYPVPHNIALTHHADKLYVTHSGASSDKVTVYTIARDDGVPEFAGEITVGLNPFGLAYVP